jgi:hypothetical protein
MGMRWDDPLDPECYPTSPTWFEAIALSPEFRMRPTGFPLRNWNPDMLALVALAEFAGTD